MDEAPAYDGTVAAPPAEPRYLLRSEHPQVAVTWGTTLLSDRPRPDTLKLRKRVTAWPLEFTFKADYHTASREFSYGMMCRDALIKGHISLNVPRQRVDYCKRVPLSGGAHLAVNASCELQDQRLKPDLRVTVEFGTHSSSAGSGTWARLGDGATAVTVAGPGGSSFDLSQRFKVAKGLALEVCGNVRLPSPAAQYSPGSGQLMLGEGAFQLHLAQVNAVVHL